MSNTSKDALRLDLKQLEEYEEIQPYIQSDQISEDLKEEISTEVQQQKLKERQRRKDAFMKKINSPRTPKRKSLTIENSIALENKQKNETSVDRSLRHYSFTATSTNLFSEYLKNIDMNMIATSDNPGQQLKLAANYIDLAKNELCKNQNELLIEKRKSHDIQEALKKISQQIEKDRSNFKQLEQMFELSKQELRDLKKKNLFLSQQVRSIEEKNEELQKQNEKLQEEIQRIQDEIQMSAEGRLVKCYPKCIIL